MKFKQITQAALLAALVTACSGDEPEQAAPATTDSVAVVSTIAAPTTLAPTTTVAVAEPAPTPDALAFTSAQDLGRLFEVRSNETSYVNAGGGDTNGQIPQGTLVQSASARSEDSGMWVRVESTDGENENLGWVLADRLIPTSLFAVVDNPDMSGELRSGRRAHPIVNLPGSSDEVGSIGAQEVLMHGGSEAISASGDTYLDVINSTTRSRIGWVRADEFVALRSNVAQDQDGAPSRTRMDPSVTYGAPLQSVTISTTGCNAAQVTISNPSGSQGLAVVLGEEVPTGKLVNGKERWSAVAGGVLYIAPSGSATLTLMTDIPRTWYFAALNEQLQAEAPRGLDGALLGADGGNSVATTRSEAVPIAGGSCAYIAPVISEQELDPLGLGQLGRDEAAGVAPTVDDSQSSELDSGDTNAGTPPTSTLKPLVQSGGKAGAVTGADEEVGGAAIDVN